MPLEISQSFHLQGDVERKDSREELMRLVSVELFEAFLVPPTSLPLHELLYFDDLIAVRRRISGAPRSAIHTALNNPHHYLEVILVADCGSHMVSIYQIRISVRPDFWLKV